MLKKLISVSPGIIHRFPEGNNPFQSITRLLEDSSELAQQANHFEGSGIKLEKYGDPDHISPPATAVPVDPIS